MQTTLNRSSSVLRIAAGLFAFVAVIGAARADIYQWEYIDPADPSRGKQQSTTLAPNGAGASAAPGADLSYRNLTKAYLIDADLRNASIWDATLTDADFQNADVRGASFALSRSTPGPTGITLAQLYSTASYQEKDLTGVGLFYNMFDGGDFSGQNLVGADFGGTNLIGADFSGANLADASFDIADLSGADFTGAVIRGANFVGNYFRGGITLQQLYSTASYRAKDLSGINFGFNNLGGGNFAGQNLTNAVFGYSLEDRDFTAADTRGAYPSLDTQFSVTTNLIQPDGRVDGLELLAGDELVARDYDGDVRFVRLYEDSHLPTRVEIPPIPILIERHLTMGPGGTLRMVFEADQWDSTISFEHGIPIALGGTLELTFADDVNLASQIGRTFDIFNWTGVNPTGAFAVSSPYVWDTSRLYTTGQVMLVAVSEPSARLLLTVALASLIASHYVRSTPNGLGLNK